jgi:CRISPR-associated protein Csm1
LAHTIQQKFSEFTADNSRITLSGGITIHPQKYPLYLAAQEAGAALDREAKGFTRPNGHPKDALAFLGQTVGWESYPAFKAQVEQWVEWVQAGVASKGDLQLLRRAAALHREEQQRAIRAGKLRADQRYLGSWAWHIVYALSRRREKAKGKHPDYVRALDELEEALIEGEAIRAIGWVARWAELLTRGGA